VTVDLLTPLLKIVGFLSIPVVVVSIFLMIKSIGRRRRISQRGLLIQLGLSPTFLVVYALLLGVGVAVKWAIPLIVVGLGIGLFWGQGTRLDVRSGETYGTRSIWYLLAWGVSFVLTQMLALFASDGATAGGLAVMVFSTSAAVGMNGLLLLRRSTLLSGAGEEVVA
jgi:hypothetical protein